MGHPNRKYKGRVLFQGNHVRGEENTMALFRGLGSAPASVAAAKMLDLVASMPGCRGGQTDAVRAYTQALLKGTETWIRIPRDRWPSSWKGKRDPVILLRLALNGHPDSGSFWERHC